MSGGRIEFGLWGGRAVVCCASADRLTRAVTVVREVITSVDRTCSPYVDDSDLNRLNRAGDAWIEVDEVFVEVLGTAVWTASATGGLTDPTVGAATLPAPTMACASAHPHRTTQEGGRVIIDYVPSPKARSDWREIEIDAAGSRVRKAADLRIDLGSTAKAWCADRAATRAAEATGVGVLVSLGGDIAVSGEPPAGGWHVYTADDHRDAPEPEARTGSAYVTIRSGGLATSSTAVRRRPVAGASRQTVAHVVDPSTMEPVEGPWRTVSVAAATCAEANAASTAALVRGVAAKSWLDRTGLPARLVRHDGRVELAGGWPR